MTYAKYPLKFCAIGLYFILIATCVPTAFAQSQDYTLPCLLSVNKVTPRDVSLWTGAALFAPEILEKIEIIYTYPIDGVLRNDVLIDAETNLRKINTNSILIGKLGSVNQFVVKGSLSSLLAQENNPHPAKALARPRAISDTEDRAITRDQIPNLPDYSGEKKYWTSKQRWESAIAHSKKQVWAESQIDQIEAEHGVSIEHQGSDGQRKWTFPRKSCLEAASVE